jgi:hypothetical protein
MARKNSAPKSLRRSRKPRLRSSISSEWLKYEPSDNDWVQMEGAIGKPFPVNLRSETVKIIQRYFQIQPFEANAPFLEDGLRRIDLIVRAAEQLQSALDANNDPVVVHVRAQLEQEFGSHEIETLDEMLRSLLSSAQYTEIAFSEQSKNGFVEGDAWHEMMSSLKALMRSHSMPYGASQDSTKAKDPNGSRFVQFVQSLQETFPVKLRRHHLSGPFALAKEINGPRRSVRKRDTKALS